jgi:hypothetical protein
MEERQTENFTVLDELGKLKNESLGGSGKILLAVFLGKKQYAYLTINKENKLTFTLRCKGISEPFLIFSDYMKAFGNHQYSRETKNEESIKTFGSDKNFFKVRTMTSTRTFNKTSFSSRLAVDSDGTISSFGVYTIPHGHHFDTFRHGESWWKRYRYRSEDCKDYNPNDWVDYKKKEEEKIELESRENKKRKLQILEKEEKDVSLLEELNSEDEEQMDMFEDVSVFFDE